MFQYLLGKCSLHDATLLEDEVPVRYGLIRLSPEYRDAQREEFPNARPFVLGGCRVDPDAPKTRSVRYCPKCRDAERLWQQRHDDPAA